MVNLKFLEVKFKNGYKINNHTHYIDVLTEISKEKKF